MKLTCPSCRTVIAGADIDLGRGVGVCRACGELVPLPASSALATTAEASTALYRPSDMRWQEQSDGGTTRIVFLRKRGQALFTIPFLLFWFGFLGLWYFLALKSGNVVMLVFPILHVGAGLYMAWTTARLFNKSELVLDDDGLTTREGPVPAPRSAMTFTWDRIRGFEASARPAGRGRTTHRVSVQTAEGTSVLLPMIFDDGAHAIFASDRLRELVDDARMRKLGERRDAYRD